MSINFEQLANEPRLLLQAQLKPAQGTRFQPTGFPDLGAATFQGFDESGNGIDCVLIESAQSMANRLEEACWDESADDLVAELQGLPFVRCSLPDDSVTDSIREAHRLNSPYIVNSEEFQNTIKPAIGYEENKPFNRRLLATALLRYDPNSLLHGTFLEKVGGAVRLPRAISGFIEAEHVSAAESGGVKFDRVQPASGENTPYGKANEGYGNVPYHRTEYTAARITAYFNVDLAQLRAYGLKDSAYQLLVALALFKMQAFLHGGLRLRTACDLDVIETTVTRPTAFKLPDLSELQAALPGLIAACGEDFASPPVTEVLYKK